MSRFIRLLLLGLCLTGVARAAEVSLSDRIALLVAAYPEVIEGAADGMLRLRNGTSLRIDDAARKTHQEMLANADVEDMLSQVYPTGPCELPPVVNFDPGRIRSEALLGVLYGTSPAEVRESFAVIDWFGERLDVTTRHGFHAALTRVRDTLRTEPLLVPYLIPSGGTFNWRTVAGTKRLSVHAFGAAIDLNTKFADYWVWSGGKPGNVPKYRNRFPLRLIEVFEENGFIWGGRWYHYDTMHFEYRPELIAISRAAGASACP